VELRDSGTPLSGRNDHSGHRSGALHDAGCVLRRLADVPRAGRPGGGAPRARPGGRAHHRHQRSHEPGRHRIRGHAVRIAHRDAGARPRKRPAAHLQQLVREHDVRRAGRWRDAAHLPRYRHHRSSAGRPGGCLVPALRAVRRPGRGHRACPLVPRHLGDPRRHEPRVVHRLRGSWQRRQRVHHRPRPRRLEGRPEVALPQGDGRHLARPLLIVHVGRRGPGHQPRARRRVRPPTARRPTTRSSGRSSSSTPTREPQSASSRSHGRRRTSRTARPTTTTSSRFATGT
jgi:hypothetical protein